jgi:hypothetical protein
MTKAEFNQLVQHFTVDELHRFIVTNTDMKLHGDIERACIQRIANIERLPLGRDGRWWHYAQAQAFPFGN